MSVPREALDFYADDELAILREQCLNRLIDRRLDSRARADLKQDVGLIGHELATRSRAARRHRQLIQQLTLQE